MTSPRHSSLLKDPQFKQKIKALKPHKMDLSLLEGGTGAMDNANPPDIEDIRACFYARLGGLRFPEGGIPAILLQPPCRPWGAATDDLEMGFAGPFEGQQLAGEWILVHGYFRKSGLAYAWLEDECAGVVYDIDLDVCFTSARYPKARGVIEVARYTVDQAEELNEFDAQRPYGPWFEGAVDPDPGFYVD